MLWKKYVQTDSLGHFHTIQRAERADSLGMAGGLHGLCLQSECPQAKMCDSFLTFKIEVLHALLAVSMPNILLVSGCILHT